MLAPHDCFLASDSPIPSGSSPCRQQTSSSCRWPWGFLPAAFRVRGSAAAAAANASAEADLSWEDGSFAEVAHTSRCGVAHCDRGIWFYSARGCSGLLWNVGRSLRAMNKLHAHALLAGENATCELVGSSLRGARVRTAHGTRLPRNKHSYVSSWLDRMQGRRADKTMVASVACRQWIEYFSTRSYALRPDGGRSFDPLDIIGSSLFDEPLVAAARRSGFDSVQLALQPGGATKKTNGYVEAGGSKLDVEFLDVRDGRTSCEIESDPSRLLPHMRALRRTAEGRHVMEPCKPTTHFHACMACDGVVSGCMTHAAMRHERHPLLRRRMADSNWTVGLLHYMAARLQASSARASSAGWAPFTDESVARDFYQGLATALSGCPLARDEVRESIAPMLKGIVASRCSQSPCDVVRAIRAFPNRVTWPINESACGANHRVRCKWRKRSGKNTSV